MLASGPLAPLAANALPDEAVALLIKEGALPPNATSAGGAPAASGAVVSVVAASVENVALGADIWAFHSSAPVPAAALSRGVPLAGGGWFLPLDFSGWPGLVGAVPTGVLLSVVSAQWSLTGAPLAGLYQPPGLLSGAVGGAHQVDIIPAATSITATVPAGTLRPGYVYRPSAMFSLSARWSFAARPQPWAVGGTWAPPPALSGVTFDASENVAPPQVVTAYAPLLYVHAPPVGGIVGIAPTSGTALLTRFSISSAGWMSGDAAVLLNSPPDALAPSTVAALALTLGQGAPSGSSTPCLGAGGALQALLATALGASSNAALCTLAANGRAASAAALAATAPLPTALTFSYTVTDDAATVLAAQSSSGWPLGLFASAAGALSASGYTALAQLQAPLRAGAALLPGAALAKGLIFPLLPQQTLSSMAAPEAALQALLLSATVTDSYGGVGVGFGFVALASVATAAPPPSAGLAAAANFVATSLGGGAGGVAAAGSAYDAVLLVSQAAAGASLLASAGTGASPAITSVRTGLLESIATAATVLAPSDPATAASAAASSLSSVTSLVAAAAVAAAANPPNTPAEALAASTLAAAATSSVASLLGLYNATGLPVPVAPLAGVLSGALAVAASGTGGGTAPVVSAEGLPLGGNTLPLSTGGVAPALRNNITSALSAVASSLLAGAAPNGAPLGLTTAPPAAVSRAPPVAPYCGPGFSLSALRVAASPAERGVVLAVGSPMNPCLPSSEAVVTLPAAAVAAQPPPTAVLPRAVINALAAAARGTAFDVILVQWGLSPNPESAFASTRYTSLPAASDAAVNAALSVQSEAGGRRRGLLSSWFFSAVAALGGRTAGQASLDALTTATPRAVTDEDLLPNRPMDSRTVSVRVNPAGSPRSLAGLVTPEPFTLVIPLRDLSAMKMGPGGGFAINLGQAAFAARAFNVTCPLSLAAAQAGVVAFELTPSGAVGARVPVKLVKAQQVDFTDIVAELVDAAGSASGSDGALAGGGTDASLNTIPSDGGAATASPPPTFSSAFYSYILSLDCGSPFGARTLVCGPNSGGTIVKYACPLAAPVPKCYRFNEAAGVWTTDGTRVVGADLTSVNCSTVHIADHAVRFVTLPQVLADVFYQQAPLTQVTFFFPSPAFTVAAAVLLVVCVAGATIGFCRSAEAKSRWAAALAVHPEVAWLAHECRAAGTPFSLLPSSDFGGRGGRGAKVLPDDEATPQQSAKVAPAPLARGARALAPTAIALSSSPLHNALSAAAVDYFAPYRAASSGWAAGAPQSGPVVPATPPPLDAFLDEWRATRAPTPNRAMNALRGGAAPALNRLTCHRLRAVPPPLLVAVWPLLFCGSGTPRAPTAYFHPSLPASLPAPTRLLVSLCAALGCAVGACALYTPLLGVAAPRGKLQLPALTGAQLAALSAAVAVLVGAPLDILLCFLLKHLARARAASASPSLARERERRAAAAALLSPLPSSALAALLGQPLGPEEAGALDSDAPPGWVSPPSWLLNLMPTFAYTAGRHPAQADAAVDAAVAAAAESPTDAVGLARAFSARFVEAAAGAPLAPSPLHAFFTSSTVWASALLAAVGGYALSYVRAWVFTRGAAAGASITAAWGVSLVIYLIVVAPALRAAELSLAPLFFTATVWIPAPAPGEFAAWTALDGWASIAAAGRASGGAEADALAALLPPRALAALAMHAANASPNKEARARRLRAALLVRAYHLLLQHAAGTDAVVVALPAPLDPLSPSSSSVSAPRFANSSRSASPPEPFSPPVRVLPALAQPLADADSLNALIAHPLTTRLGALPSLASRGALWPRERPLGDSVRVTQVAYRAASQLKGAIRERSATASGHVAGGGDGRSQKGLNLMRGLLNG